MKKHITTSLALIACFAMLAQKPGKYMPDKYKAFPATTFTYESVPNDPLNVRIYTLKNGLKVYLSVYKNAPRIQTYIAVRAGSKNDPANATGLAHYLEHMVFKGTDVFGTKDFAKESAEIKKIEDLYELYRQTKDDAKRKSIYHQIDSISGEASKYAIANEYDKMLAVIGADGTNAFTSFDQTVYVNDIPSNQIANWLKIEAERFRKPILRLFHTELEAVYEEKNRGLDNDDEKVWEAVFEALFKNHTYGTQTTIGTIEHLKNPSMLEINKYYQSYYVPNNMAIIMSGDFDPDKVIFEIDRNFGAYQSKAVNTYTYLPEAPLAGKVSREIVGPNPANVNLAWRLAGDGSREADLCTVFSSMLFNNTAGLFDINLNQAQKVLSENNYLVTYIADANYLGIFADVHWISKAPNDMILKDRLDVPLRILCYSYDGNCKPATPRISDPVLEKYGLIQYESPYTTREFAALTPRERYAANFNATGQAPFEIPERFIGGNPYYNQN
ncbi:MAG: insulinase family protein [Bacteroidota bacterium]